jgi:Zn-finger nucleic acid-binding protein
MKCPACASPLQPVQAGEVTVDACLGGCGGLWFDNFELKKLDEPAELDGNLLIPVNVAVRRDLHLDETARRHCPKCSDVVMMRHFFSAQRRVEVDECPNCGGFWLDAGELAEIRAENGDEQRRRTAVEAYFNEMSRLSLASADPGTAENIRRSRTINQLLQFTRPIRFQEHSA